MNWLKNIVKNGADNTELRSTRDLIVSKMTGNWSNNVKFTEIGDISDHPVENFGQFEKIYCT